MSKCFQWVTQLETTQSTSTIEYPAYRGKSECDMQLMVLDYRPGRCRLVGLEDKAQPLDTICQKCSNFSNYYRPQRPGFDSRHGKFGFHGVMVSTLDSESSDPSSNLGGTLHFATDGMDTY
ncbi:hypothetical protein TNCV_2204321 [Trichonephila clavipes]|nr:hypothetical protein TNCV_2204321 [Trichonephila clavipes]